MSQSDWYSNAMPAQDPHLLQFNLIPMNMIRHSKIGPKSIRWSANEANDQFDIQLSNSAPSSPVTSAASSLISLSPASPPFAPSPSSVMDNFDMNSAFSFVSSVDDHSKPIDHQRWPMQKRNPSQTIGSEANNIGINHSELPNKIGSTNPQQFQSNLLSTTIQSMLRKKQLMQRRAAVMAAAAAINPIKSSAQTIDKSLEGLSHQHPSTGHKQEQQQSYQSQRALTMNLAEAIANYRNAQQQQKQSDRLNGVSGLLLHSPSATSGLQMNSDSTQPIGATRRGGWRRVSKTTSFLGNNVSDCIQKCVLQGVLHPVQCHSLC